jgi:hypothetical protein
VVRGTGDKDNLVRQLRTHVAVLRRTGRAKDIYFTIIVDDEIDILIGSNKDQRRYFSWVGGLLFLLVGH